jgi:beta-phosphoglucomutase-like phosphatase (HAD superfamily)
MKYAILFLLLFVNNPARRDKIMKIRGVAFDLEGVLIDVEEAHHQAHILSAADVGIVLTYNDCLERLPHFIGGPDTQVAREIAKLAGEADPDYVLNRKRYHYSVLIKSLPAQLRPGVPSIFNQVGELGLKMTVGSLTPTAEAIPLLEKTGLLEIFGESRIFLRESVRHLKPDPEIWFKTAERMGISSQEQLVFEDSPYGIAAANAAGSIAVGMPVVHKQIVIKNLLEAGSARVFWDWREMDFRNLISNLSLRE